jgi:hypothetical protein
MQRYDAGLVSVHLLLAGLHLALEVLASWLWRSAPLRDCIGARELRITRSHVWECA